MKYRRVVIKYGGVRNFYFSGGSCCFFLEGRGCGGGHIKILRLWVTNLGGVLLLRGVSTPLHAMNKKELENINMNKYEFLMKKVKFVKYGTLIFQLTCMLF